MSDPTVPSENPTRSSRDGEGVLVYELLAELRASRQAVRDQQAEMARERHHERRWRVLMRLVVFGLPALLGLVYAALAYETFRGDSGPSEDAVGLVRIDGEIAAESISSARNVVGALTRAFESPVTKAIVLCIDSPGGAPAEAERITDALATLKKKHPKPVVAVISNVGASAAYMVAMHADQIYAGKYSLVGSIGAIVSGWDLHRALQKLDVEQRTYASGHLKSMLNPFEPMSAEAEAKAEQLVAKIGRTFVGDLETRRGSHLVAGTDYATGELWGGEEAKAIGLVDEIGTLDQIVNSRWGLRTHDFGPRERAGYGLLGSWAQSTVTSMATATARAVVDEASRVGLR